MTENNSKPKHYAVIVGARPNFVKIAPLFIRAKNYPNFKFTLIHTGQHFDKNMSRIFFDQMSIPKPHISLDINMKKLLHTEKIGLMNNRLGNILSAKDFDGIIVVGDVISTLSGAINAAKLNKPLIHIESGLRSHDRRMPEEIVRVTVDHISDLLFVTEPSAEENLLKEGISKNKIKYVGNIMIESIELFRHKMESSKILKKLGLKKKNYVTATIHRQENTDSLHELNEILSILNKISKSIEVVFPIHPGTQKKIKEFNLKKLLKNLKVIKPLGYFDFMKLMAESRGCYN